MPDESDKRKARKARFFIYSKTQGSMKTANLKTWLRKSNGPAAILVSALAFPILALAADLERVYAPYQALLERHLVERELPRGGLISAFEYRAALASPETMALLEQ